MELRKDDPVYYKVKLKELLKRAQDNGVKVFLDGNAIMFSTKHECAGIAIYKED